MQDEVRAGSRRHRGLWFDARSRWIVLCAIRAQRPGSPRASALLQESDAVAAIGVLAKALPRTLVDALCVADGRPSRWCPAASDLSLGLGYLLPSLLQIHGWEIAGDIPFPARWVTLEAQSVTGGGAQSRGPS